MLSEIGDECLTDVHCDVAVNNRYTRLYCLCFSEIYSLIDQNNWQYQKNRKEQSNKRRIQEMF